MATAFSLVSWNVEHFKGKPERLKRVVKFLKAQNPDILGLYEVEGKEVFRELSRTMPNYSFHITEGRQSQEILVGVKSGFTSFFSQRVAFKAGNSWLRPGALLTVTIDEADYSLLFLHLKSKSEPVGLGLRDDQLAKAQKLKKKLDKAQPGAKRANFMVLGDLNTMGMKYIKGKGISGNLELAKLDKDLARKSVARRRMQVGGTALAAPIRPAIWIMFWRRTIWHLKSSTDSVMTARPRSMCAAGRRWPRMRKRCNGSIATLTTACFTWKRRRSESCRGGWPHWLRPHFNPAASAGDNVRVIL